MGRVIAMIFDENNSILIVKIDVVIMSIMDIDSVAILLIHLRKSLVLIWSILLFHLFNQIRQKMTDENENLSNVVEYDVKWMYTTTKLDDE